MPLSLPEGLSSGIFPNVPLRSLASLEAGDGLLPIFLGDTNPVLENPVTIKEEGIEQPPKYPASVRI